MTPRNWLQADYPDVLGLIDEVMAEFKASGSRERRNWWAVLAGGEGGTPLMVAGRVFPVLRAAQIRQGKVITEGALCRNQDEVPPGVVATKRWPRQRAATAKATYRKLQGKKRRLASAS